MSQPSPAANLDARSPVNHLSVIGSVLRALQNVHLAIDELALERSLHHLIQLRASQINRCTHCVKMHAREARENGESSARLDHLVVWSRIQDFTPRERAALRWTEALTALDERADYGSLRAELREHFSEPEIGALTATIAMINLWNRIQISSH